MRIETGIYRSSNRFCDITGWQILCEQEKTPYRITEKPDCPVMIFDAELPSWGLNYIDNGGIAIISNCHENSLPFNDYIASSVITAVDLTDICAGEAITCCLGNVFEGEGIGKISIHEQRKIKNHVISDVFPFFIYKSYGKGGCWYTGMPISRLILSLGDTLRKCSDFSEYTERIVSVDKHKILFAMRHVLKDAYHRLGLPYCYLSYYPNKYKSAFSFRIDVDGIFGQNTLLISDYAKQNNIKLTFFVNKLLSKNEHEILKKIDSYHYIGNHANVHNLYTTYADNYENVKNCELWLNQLNLNPGKWFVAPRGMWNYSLHKALEKLEYSFTSDFGFMIDGLPLFPYINGKRSSTMFVPVNAFSVERATIWMEDQKEKLDIDFILQYFKNAIANQYDNNMPIMLYSHPEKFGPVSDKIFKMINDELLKKNIWRTSLPEFTDWWRLRDNAKFDVAFHDKTRQTFLNGELDNTITYLEE